MPRYLFTVDHTQGAVGQSFTFWDRATGSGRIKDIYSPDGSNYPGNAIPNGVIAALGTGTQVIVGPDDVSPVYYSVDNGTTRTAITSSTSVAGSPQGGYSTVVTKAAQGGAVTVDLSTGDTFVLQLTGNVSGLTLTNLVAGKRFKVIFNQDATGSRTLSGLDSKVKLAGAALTLTTTASKNDVLNFEVVDTSTVREISRSLNQS